MISLTFPVRCAKGQGYVLPGPSECTFLQMTVVMLSARWGGYHPVWKPLASNLNGEIRNWRGSAGSLSIDGRFFWNRYSSVLDVWLVGGGRQCWLESVSPKRKNCNEAGPIQVYCRFRIHLSTRLIQCFDYFTYMLPTGGSKNSFTIRISEPAHIMKVN